MARLSLRAFDEEALRERISTLCDQLMRSRSGVTSAQDRVHGLEGALHAVVDKAGKAASRLAMRDAGQAGSIACHALPGGKPIRTRQGLELPAEAPGTCRLQPPAEHGGRHDLGRIHAPSGRLRGKLPVHFRQRPQASGTAHPLRCAAPVGLPRSSIMFRAQPQERSTDVGAAPTGRDQDIGRCMGRALADTKAQIGSVGGGAVRLFECRKIAGGHGHPRSHGSWYGNLPRAVELRSGRAAVPNSRSLIKHHVYTKVQLLFKTICLIGAQ
ncbi:hypothetical protein C8E08_0868 [Paracidovorax citrulli]|nr:hypothetical protein C8E08_0868 [Paracidovorax citrulli]REG67457.1 hypothetical protein C8E07_0519 [Paracidovorax citrulli]RLJ92017.1 hypothetical protein C8E06_0520 [Paracidovorax citrulli]